MTSLNFQALLLELIPCFTLKKGNHESNQKSVHDVCKSIEETEKF